MTLEALYQQKRSNSKIKISTVNLGVVKCLSCRFQNINQLLYAHEHTCACKLEFTNWKHVKWIQAPVAYVSNYSGRSMQFLKLKKKDLLSLKSFVCCWTAICLRQILVTAVEIYKAIDLLGQQPSITVDLYCFLVVPN